VTRNGLDSGLQRRSFQCAYLCRLSLTVSSTEVGKEMGKKIGALTVATQLRGVEALAEPSAKVICW